MPLPRLSNTERALYVILIMWLAGNTAVDMVAHAKLEEAVNSISTTRFTHEDGLELKQDLLTRIERLDPGYLGIRRKDEE